MGLWLKVDASRRRSDPRKPRQSLVSMVRFRSKPCRIFKSERGISEGNEPQAKPPAGGCGVKDQVSC